MSPRISSILRKEGTYHSDCNKLKFKVLSFQLESFIAGSLPIEDEIQCPESCLFEIQVCENERSQLLLPYDLLLEVQAGI